MKTLFIYPYTHEIDFLIKMRDRIREYEILKIGCFPEDKNYLERRFPNMEISSSYKEGIDSSDVFLPNYDIPDYMAKELESSKMYALKTKKEIIKIEDDFLENKNFNGYQMEQVEIPIIAIVGQGEKCSKLETLLRVQTIIKECGYDVVGISGNTFSRLFSLEKIPSYFLNENVGFSQKVFSFNQYISCLCRKKKPELLLLDIPGGLLPVGDAEYFHFGELALVASEAIQIDMAIFNFYYNVFKMTDKELSRFIREIKRYCMEKYQFPIEFCCICSQYVKTDTEGRKMECLYLKNSFLREHWGREDEDMIPLWKAENGCINKKIKKMLRKLEENIEVI